MLLLISLCGLPLQAQAPAAPLEVPYTQFTLANGLTVILHRDTTVPVVSVNVWYHVGSANERPGRTGFAHLFEHLMFEGSKNVEEGQFDILLEAAGATNNGSTDLDRTNYFIDLPANALELALFLESDRMGYLLDTMSPERVDGQRDVVKNERRQSYENRPYGMASIEMDKMLWPAGHPYSWPTIGYMEDLTAASHEDVVNFFKTYYVPNNASLVIAGDIDIARTRALVEKWFGEIPRGPVADAGCAAGRDPDRGQAADADRPGPAAAAVSRMADAARVRARRRGARRGGVDPRGRQELAAVLAAGLRDADRAGRRRVPGVRRARQLLPDHRDRAARATPSRRFRRSSTKSSRSCGAPRRTRAKCNACGIRSKRRSIAAWSASAASAARRTS